MSHNVLHLPDTGWKNKLYELMKAPDRNSFSIRASDNRFFVDKQSFIQQLEQYIQALSDLERVMVVAENSDQWIILALACLISGKELFALDAKMATDEVVKLAQNVMPDCIITNKSLDSKYGIILSFNDLKNRISTGNPRQVESKLVLFTTGTTGTPKGVEMSLVNIMTGTESFQRRFQVRPEEMTLIHAPLSHTMGFMVMMVNICYGSGAIMALNEGQILHSILHERIDWMVIPPVLANILKGRQEFMDKLKCCRAIFSSGAGLSRDTYSYFEANGVRLINGYGMTESVTVMAVTAPGQRPWETKPLDWCEIKISEQNEILARGPVFAQRYYGGGSILDDEGWYHTGDMGSYENGCLIVTNRMDNVCVLENGFKINLEDLENRISALDEVEDCRVYAKKAEKFSKLGVELVMAAGYKNMPLDQLKDKVQNVIYYYERINEYIMSEKLQTKGGKKVRHE